MNIPAIIFFSIAGVLTFWLIVIDPIMERRKRRQKINKKKPAGPRRSGKTTPNYNNYKGFKK